MKRLFLVGAMLLYCVALSAQTSDAEPQKPVRPVRTIESVSVIDTLPSGNDDLSVVLYSDNTWRYVRLNGPVENLEVFNEYWNTNVSHTYSGVSVNSLPESVAIQLVDSLHGYHYPFKAKLTSRYGMRRGRQHQGVDIPLKTGDPVYATFDGKVRFSGTSGGYGNLIVIRHHNGLETYYAHLSARNVEAGDWVVAGQEIGKGGSTGRSSGPHLHFEVRYHGHTMDPERIIDFATGELRGEELLLKRRHLSIYAKYEQDFDEETEAARQAEAEKAAASVQYHTIKKGDTLGAIARKYGTTVNKICSLNGIQSTTILQIGKKLRVK
jgi:LysM repeat protein